MTPDYYLEQARRCRRLADQITDDKARITLLALAEEYENRGNDGTEGPAATDGTGDE